MAASKINLAARTQKAVTRFWQGIREWCGDAAYERYLKSCTKQNCGPATLSREEFYLEQLQRRYSRISRCC